MPQTAIQTTRKSDKQESDSWKMSEVLAAIRSTFPDRSGSITCKFLWEKNGEARYRANWYRNGEIPYSSFLIIRKEADGFVIEDKSIHRKKEREYGF